MKAIRIHQFGGPEVLKYEEVEKPTPAADEVLIKVYATSINPVDWKIREGLRKDKFPTTFPLILGWDASGVVEAAGSEVTTLKPGDEVYSRPELTRNGTYAEYVVVAANMVGHKPKSIGHIEACTVPLAGLTAWQGLFDHGHLQAGQKVLIHAAAGGVGTYAVQFAKWKGAYVIGTASESNADFLKELGADEVIDYNTEKFEEKLQDIDLVLDTLGGEIQQKSLAVLKNGGRLITTLRPEFTEEAKAKNIVLESYTAQSYPNQLEEIATLIDAGKVKPIIAEVLPLAQTAEGQQKSKEGHVRGKIVLQVV